MGSQEERQILPHVQKISAQANSAHANFATHLTSRCHPPSMRSCNTGRLEMTTRTKQLTVQICTKYLKFDDTKIPFTPM